MDDQKQIENNQIVTFSPRFDSWTEAGETMIIGRTDVSVYNEKVVLSSRKKIRQNSNETFILRRQ